MEHPPPLDNAEFAAPLVDLKTMSTDELTQFLVDFGFPSYRGRQIFRWMYGHGCTDIAQMSNLPQGLRNKLSQVATISSLTKKAHQESSDGTLKTVYQLASGRSIEAVLIPDFDSNGNPRRLTVCVSSQVGCAMNCSFCATGKMGFHQNLSSGEIFDQVFLTNRIALETHERPLSNVVFMGMGEPLLNYQPVKDAILKITSKDGLDMSPKRITVSTVGLAGQIRRLADENLGTNLAVSLHAPFDEKRSAIMPVNRKTKTDLSALKSALQYYARAAKRPVTYEYCLFKDFNDTPADARELAAIAQWVPSKVNLIMYNPVEGVQFKRSSERTVDRFVQALVNKEVRVTVRRSRGKDIDAACGQLALR